MACKPAWPLAYFPGANNHFNQNASDSCLGYIDRLPAVAICAEISLPIKIERQQG